MALKRLWPMKLPVSEEEPIPEEAVAEEAPVEGEDRSRRFRRSVRRFTLAGAVLLVAAALLAVAEARTSWLQSRIFSRLAAGASFYLQDGPNPVGRFPEYGPFDERLGYTRIPVMVEKAESEGFQVRSQARLSEGLEGLMERGIYATYREKAQAGLVLLDAHGRPILENFFPRRVYPAFDSIPTLVRETLLHLENRELLDAGRERLNPSVEWDRLARSVLDLTLRKLGSDRSVPGASTLATQLEKYRHSPDGRTSSPSEKLRQMKSASLRAYLDGPFTLETRRRIVMEYLNTVPLAAARGQGEVSGLLEGLWAWYGTDSDDANLLLRSSPDSLEPAERARKAEVYRQVVSLFVAQRRPSFFLTSGSGQAALEALTDQNIRLLMRARVIPEDLSEDALSVRTPVLLDPPPIPPPSFVERKAQNKIRSALLPLLGVSQLYELDRMDLTVRTSLDLEKQERATRLLSRLSDTTYVAESGLTQPRLLDRGDPARVIYSFTLSERTPEGNRVRIQTDNFNGPFDINEGSRIELGSSAKLRTLVTYLELVERLHDELGAIPQDSLRLVDVHPLDRLTRWAVDYHAARPDVGREEMLRASLLRQYSTDSGERFFTGGGTQVFSNFDATRYPARLTVLQGFQQSVNLVWVRVMQDMVRHLTYRSPAAHLAALEDPEAAIRQEYLTRFAQREGGIYVGRFFRKYTGLEADSILPVLVEGRRLSPTRMAWAFRTVRPEAPLDAFSLFLETHASNAWLTEGSAADLYLRTDPEGQTLADLGYLASVHPLELWVARYLTQNPGAGWEEVQDASLPQLVAVYDWLFRTSRRNAQDIRIRSILELEAFSEILRMWKRLGYPFDNIVPSLGTAIGSSGDRPAALAELVGILLNDGLRAPTFRVESLHFAIGTPFEVDLQRTPSAGERVLSAEVATVVREALSAVVEGGTGVRVRGSLVDSEGRRVPIGGKTGTGDNRFRVFAPGGRMVESRPVNRTSTFVFFLGDRYFGVITAFVPGPEAGGYGFTSSLPLEILRRMLPELGLFEARQPEGGGESG